MRIVDRPYARPNRCAALPYVGQTTRTRWVDTGSEMHGPDDHVYLSEEAVTTAAKLFGWVPPGELRQRDREITRLEGEKTDLIAANARLTAVLDAVDVMESRGYTARKKPGRPPKQREEIPA